MEILTGRGSVYKLREYLNGMGAKRVHIITDENVGRLYIDGLKKIIEGYDIGTYILPAGEASKSITTVMAIYDDFIKKELDRDTIILSFGGGVVGDVAGFAASTYKRGLKYIQIPTTLLAQVDSSVGGKVGIDYGGHKNLIGSFYFPELTIVDIQFVESLLPREIICGLSEVFKYGLIYDYDFFQLIRNNLHSVYKMELDILLKMIKRSIEIKKEIVEKDRYDRGLRRILNFGHTIGHSIESYYNFSKYNHGEAIILGMIYESNIAYQIGFIDEEYFKEIYFELGQFVSPIKFTHLEISDLICRMKHDKKNVDNKITFVLPRGKGRVEVFIGIDKKIISKSLAGEWI